MLPLQPQPDHKGNYKAPFRWHEVVADLWRRVGSSDNVQPSALVFIARMNIENKPTQDLMQPIIQNEDFMMTGRLRFQWNFGPDNPNFYALLGTPNGQSIPKLLGEYVSLLATVDPNDSSKILKVKTIAKVRMHYDRSIPPDLTREPIDGGQTTRYELAFILKDVDMPSGTSKAEKETYVTTHPAVFTN